MNSGTLRPSPAVRASISDDGLVILDVSGGELLASNTVGARIWMLIEAGRCPHEIARDIVEAFDIPLERAQHDVDAFIAGLQARGLVNDGASS